MGVKPRQEDNLQRPENTTGAMEGKVAGKEKAITTQTARLAEEASSPDQEVRQAMAVEHQSLSPTPPHGAQPGNSTSTVGIPAPPPAPLKEGEYLPKVKRRARREAASPAPKLEGKNVGPTGKKSVPDWAEAVEQEEKRPTRDLRKRQPKKTSMDPEKSKPKGKMKGKESGGRKSVLATNRYQLLDSDTDAGSGEPYTTEEEMDTFPEPGGGETGTLLRRIAWPGTFR
nr:PREDICTED: translation initiation factor IF-2-like [Latimeria chalumnae]|eukprot:XP_014339775.1 PREDICTED: translation initiation factor IF-2-like [Latimeria chalumnae]